jgi:long-subunit acyl-CoA synthetase (AMP-forming)
VIAAFATWQVGGIFVAEDRFIRPVQLRALLQDLCPAVVLIDPAQLGPGSALQEAISDLGTVRAIYVNGGPVECDGPPIRDLRSVLEEDRDSPCQRPALPREVATITCTSGSTGKPKGVMHTHESWLAGAEFTKDYHGLGRADSVIVSLPLQHGLAFRQLLAYLWAGGTVILADDLLGALEQVQGVRSAALLLVPTACNLLLDNFATDLRRAAGHLNYLEIGSAALEPRRYEQLRQLLPDTPIHLPYGLTEARVAYLERGSQGLLNRIASVATGLELDVIGAEGRPAGPGLMGEVRVRGRGLMKGYWGFPAEHEQA